MDLIDVYSSKMEIHPRYKKQVGERLADGALHFTYGENTYYTGPVYQSCGINDNEEIIVNYTKSIADGDIIELRLSYGFEVNNGIKWIKVPIKSNDDYSITLDVKGISNIEGLRYIWGDNACCPESYEGKSGFKCDIYRCPIYGVKSKLPSPPFISKIYDGVCLL